MLSRRSLIGIRRAELGLKRVSQFGNFEKDVRVQAASGSRPGRAPAT